MSGPSPVIRIVVADNSRMSSQLLADALRRSRNPRFEVAVPSALTTNATVAEIERTRPDVAVLSKDFQSNPLAAFCIVRGIRAAQIPTKSVLLLDNPEKDLVIDAFRAGIRGVFPRSESSRMLCRCIERVHSGQIWASTQELHYLLQELE